MPDDFSLQQLADAADVPVRTVRYYVERELLPPPDFKSRNTRYGSRYLTLLHAIATLRKQRWGIDAIRKKLARATHEEILALAQASAPRPPPLRPRRRLRRRRRSRPLPSPPRQPKCRPRRSTRCP